LSPPLVTTLACLQGPGADFLPAPSYPPVSWLVRGLSADEAWWNGAAPLMQTNPAGCRKSKSVVTGDISSLPLIEPPIQPSGAASSMFVEITGITANAQGAMLSPTRCVR
jgi:hypothetical protein